MRQAPAVDDFPGLMREWAQWFESLDGLGFSDSTTLWRAQFGRGGTEFSSCAPAGLDQLETHGALRRLIEAMDSLLADSDTRIPVRCVQALYLLGPLVAMEAWGGSKTKFYEAIRTGEILIRREVKR